MSALWRNAKQITGTLFITPQSYRPNKSSTESVDKVVKHIGHNITETNINAYPPVRYNTFASHFMCSCLSVCLRRLCNAK